MRAGHFIAMLAAVGGISLMPSAASASYDSCGEIQATNAAGGSGVFETKAKGMNCSGARDLLRTVWRRAGDNFIPDPGNTTTVKRFKCSWVSHYGPGNVAFQCRHTRQRHKAAKAYWVGDKAGVLPALSERDATSFMERGLIREFGASYSHGYAQKVGCHRRLSRTKVKCRKISWFIGDLAYDGVGRVWYAVSRMGGVRWNYAFKIRRINEYCLDTGGSHCVKVIRVR